MVEIYLSDELVDLVGENVFAPALGFYATVMPLTRMVAGQTGWDWLAYNCSIAIPDVQVLSSGASVN